MCLVRGQVIKVIEDVSRAGEQAKGEDGRQIFLDIPGDQEFVRENKGGQDEQVLDPLPDTDQLDEIKNSLHRCGSFGYIPHV